MPELRNDLLDDDGDDLELDGDPAGDPSKSGGNQKSTDKRISDLQSAKDKETARANKLQKQLDAMLAAAKGDDAEGGKPPKAPADSGDALTGYMTEMARMFAVQQYPKLAEYGLSGADLTGSTPGEIAQSAAALVARYEKLETTLRNKVLAENGLAPEIETGNPAPSKAKDFSKMSAEDFKKVVDEALARR
jgi:hypothetical protein